MNLNFVTVFVVLICSFSHKTVHSYTTSALNCTFEKILRTIKFQRSVNPENLQELLESLHEKINKIVSRNVISSVLASHYLDIQKLLREKEQSLSSQVSLENVLDLYVLSSDFKFPYLKQNCENLLRKEKKQILENNKLLNLNFEEITEVLQIIEIANENDEILREKMFHFMISWVEKDSKNRNSFLSNLLKILPLHELSHAFLKENVLHHPLITNSSEYSELLNEALSKTYFASHSKKSSSSHSSPQLYCLG